MELKPGSKKNQTTIRGFLCKFASVYVLTSRSSGLELITFSSEMTPTRRPSPQFLSDLSCFGLRSVQCKIGQNTPDSTHAHSRPFGSRMWSSRGGYIKPSRKQDLTNVSELYFSQIFTNICPPFYP
jgi:hypothetical protein